MRTVSSMPEYLSCFCTKSVRKWFGTCSWLGLTQRTKYGCVLRSTVISSSSDDCGRRGNNGR